MPYPCLCLTFVFCLHRSPSPHLSTHCGYQPSLRPWCVQVRDKMGPQSAQVDVRVALRPRRWYSLAITHAMGRSAISQARPWLSQVRLSSRHSPEKRTCTE